MSFVAADQQDWKRPCSNSLLGGVCNTFQHCLSKLTSISACSKHSQCWAPHVPAMRGTAHPKEYAPLSPQPHSTA